MSTFFQSLTFIIELFFVTIIFHSFLYCSWKIRASFWCIHDTSLVVSPESTLCRNDNIESSSDSYQKAFDVVYLVSSSTVQKFHMYAHLCPPLWSTSDFCRRSVKISGIIRLKMVQPCSTIHNGTQLSCRISAYIVDPPHCFVYLSVTCITQILINKNI